MINTKNDGLNYVQQRERGRGSISLLVISSPWLNGKLYNFNDTSLKSVMCVSVCGVVGICHDRRTQIYSPKGIG